MRVVIKMAIESDEGYVTPEKEVLRMDRGADSAIAKASLGLTIREAKATLFMHAALGLVLAVIGGVSASAGEKETAIAAGCAAKAGMSASVCAAAPAACGVAYAACLSAGLTASEIATCASNPQDCFGPNNDLVKAINSLYPPKGKPWTVHEIEVQNEQNRKKAEFFADKERRHAECEAKKCWWRFNEGDVNQNYGPSGACLC